MNGNSVIRFLLGAVFCAALSHAQTAPPNPAAAEDFLYAQKLFQEGYHELCVSQLEALMQRYPDAPEVVESWRLLGQANFAVQRYAAAEKALRMFEMRYPQHPALAESQLLLAESQQAQGKLSEAALTYQRLAYFHPGSAQAPMAAYKACELLLQAGEIEQARKNLYEMMDKHAQSSYRLAAHLLLVESFTQAGEYQRGLQEAERLFRLFPEKDLNAQAYFTRSRLQEQLGQYQLAQEGYQEQIQRYPKGEWSRLANARLAELAFARGEVNAALAALARVEADSPARTEMNAMALRAAEMNIHIGKTQEAGAALQKFDASVADSASLLSYFYTLGALREQSGEVTAAIEAYRRALGLPAGLAAREKDALTQPRHLRQRCFWRSAQLYFDAKKHEAALSVCRQYRREYPDGQFRDALLLLEANIQRQGLLNPAHAQKLYFELLEDFPRSVYVDDAQFALAESFTEAGERQMARLQWQRFAQFYGASELAPAAQSRLRLITEFQPNDAPESMRQFTEMVLRAGTNAAAENLELALARLHYQRRDFPAAAQASREALQASLENGAQREAVFLLGASYYQLSERERLYDRLSAARQDSARALLQQLLSEEGNDRFEQEARIMLARLEISTNASRSAELLGHVDAVLSRAENHAELDDLRLWAAVTRKQLAAPNDSLMARQITLALQKVAATEDSPYRNQALWELADWHLKQGAAAAATNSLELLRASKLHDAAQARGQLLLARRLQKDKEYDAALAELQAVRDKFFYCAYADSAQAQLLQVLIAAGRLQEALQLMGDPREHDYAGTDGIDLQRARLEEAAGDYGPAILTYLRFLENHSDAPEAPVALVAAAKLSRRVGAEALAAGYFEECIRRFPNTEPSDEARFQLAEINYDKGDYSEALGLYVAFMQERPDSPFYKDAMKKSVLCWYKTKNPVRAEAEAKVFRERYKDDRESPADFYYAAGELAIQEKNFPVAEEAFKKLSREYRGTEAGILGEYGLGKALLIQNKTQDALETLTAIPGRYPKHPFLPTVYLGLGDFYLANQQWDNAIEAFKQVVKDSTFDNNYKLGTRSLIDVYDRMGLKDRALALARHYVSRFPDDDKAFDLHMKIALLLNDLQQYDDAISLLRSLKPFADAAAEPEVQYYIGKSHMNAGRFEPAIAELLRVKFFSKPTKLPWDVIAMYDAAICYTRLNRCAKAKQLFQRIVREQGAASEFGRFANVKINELGACPEAN